MAVFRMLAYFGSYRSYHWVTLVSKIFGRIIFRSCQFSVNLSTIFQVSVMAFFSSNCGGRPKSFKVGLKLEFKRTKTIKPDLQSAKNYKSVHEGPARLNDYATTLMPMNHSQLAWRFVALLHIVQSFQVSCMCQKRIRWFETLIEMPCVCL